ncbi:MAG: zinc ribbon domain-containing protein [Dehalococcoidia bacterium]
MPVYEYRCTKGHDFEKTEGFSAPTMQKCIVCGARARRQISMPSVIFKGSGFYSTDNRGSSSAGNAGSSETASTKSDSSDTKSGSSDTKSDTKPDSTNGSGHGHSHGDGGHSHGSGTKLEASVD